MSTIVCSLMQMTVCLGAAFFGMTAITWMFEVMDRNHKDRGKSNV